MALHFFGHNYCRAQQTITKAAKGIKTSPAMAAGLTNHVWKMEELVEKMELGEL